VPQQGDPDPQSKPLRQWRSVRCAWKLRHVARCAGVAPLAHTLLVFAAALQCVAVAYGVYLLTRFRGASAAWLCLLGAMTSMLAWRLVVLSGISPPDYFNPLIAIWGSTFMVAAMFLFGREVTARQRAEAERDTLLDSERAARANAERASRAKDDFLATLSHELRSPLAAILGWCAVMQKARRPEDLAHGLQVIHRNAQAQTRLVDDLLDVTRMRAGTLHLEFASVGLDAPVLAALQAVRPAADAKSLSIEFIAEPAVPTVNADTDRLQQVATNLVVNAVKFTPPGGRIVVRVGTQEERARLVVEDTGQGIPAEFLPHVFVPFRQADGSTTRRHGGLGLGLSIVEHLVRMHGGEVRVESPGEGRGTTFTVLLPLAGKASGRRSPEEHAAARESIALLLEGIRVLVVDDEDDVRSAVTRLLEQRGAIVASLPSGEGIESALASHRPHVLLFDIGMPGEDGYVLIRRVRQLESRDGGSTPAVSLTAHARNEDRARALASGFQQHLAKPIDVPLLVSTIHALAQVESGGSREALPPVASGVS
jgi:signal transduction histidine kinase/ActR/RegA family two-component response regulator